jgi:anti-anti-sigma factor
MEIIITKHITGATVVKPKGRFDAFGAPGMRDQFNDLLSHNGTRFVVDLTETTFMDSAGMAVLVSMLKRTRYVNGDTKLVWPAQPAARRVLHLTRFDRVFDMAETVDEAIARFSTGSQFTPLVADHPLI